MEFAPSKSPGEEDICQELCGKIVSIQESCNKMAFSMNSDKLQILSLFKHHLPLSDLGKKRAV